VFKAKGGDYGHIHVAFHSRSASHWLLASLGLVFPAVLTVLIARAAVATPYQDELTFSTLYGSLAIGAFPPLQELFAAHNGHPSLVLKLLIVFTHQLGLPWTWMMYAQVAALVGCVLIVIAQIRASSRFDFCAAALAVTFVLMTPRQWENLYWSMQLVFPVFLLTSLGAFACIARYSNSRQRKWLLSALVLSLLATESNGAGIFTLALTATALLVLRPDRYGVMAIATIAVVGGALFYVSQTLAPRSGVGGNDFALVETIEHVLRMSAHQLADFPHARVLSICIGFFLGLLALYCGIWALREWPAAIFETLCIALGIVLILGVSYVRVAAQIMQPDAPRYLPLIAPITIGCVLLFSRWRAAGALVAFASVLLTSYALSLRSEWILGPIRQANLLAAHSDLCIGNSGISLVQSAEYDMSRAALSDLQKIFCSDGPRSDVVDHNSIASSFALGYYNEVTQTWIGPEFSIRLPLGRDYASLELNGFLPELGHYSGGRFVLKVWADEVAIDERVISRSGGFSERFGIPPQTAVIRIAGTPLEGRGTDLREISWLLVSMVFGPVSGSPTSAAATEKSAPMLGPT